MQRNPGYEPMVQAFAGLFSINGYPDRPGARMGTSVLDLGIGDLGGARLHYGALQRERTGKGCVVDASLFETALGLLTVHFARYQASGKLPERHPSGSLAVVIFEALRHRRRAGHRRRRQRPAVRASSPSRWAIRNGPATRATRPTPTATPTRTRLLGCGARDHAPAPSAAWVRRLEKAGVPCSPINDMSHMRAHPQTAALGMVQPVPEIDLELMSLPLSLDGERPTDPHARAAARRAQRGNFRPCPGR